MDRPLAEFSVAELMAAARQLRHASALVVGDAMLDRYVYGRAQRISPEAPVPVLTVEREIAMPGGAGNVVRNLTAANDLVFRRGTDCPTLRIEGLTLAGA